METGRILRAGAADVHTFKPITRSIPTAGRVLMELTYFVNGLDGCLNVLPEYSLPVPEEAVAFAGTLLNAIYLIRLITGTRELAGALLLSNRFVPLALTIIEQVLVNDFAFHAYAPRSEPGVAVVVLLAIYLGRAYGTAYRPMLAMRAALRVRETVRGSGISSR